MSFFAIHDDVIKRKHFPRHWPLDSPHEGQWRGALMFSLICAWINRWVNNGDVGDLRRHRTHYDVTVMRWPMPCIASHKIVPRHIGTTDVKFVISKYFQYSRLLSMSRAPWRTVLLLLSARWRDNIANWMEITMYFDVSFDLRLNESLSKQSSGWWFETPSRPLWRHSNGWRRWLLNFDYSRGSLVAVCSYMLCTDFRKMYGMSKHATLKRNIFVFVQ